MGKFMMAFWISLSQILSVLNGNIQDGFTQ